MASGRGLDVSTNVTKSGPLFRSSSLKKFERALMDELGDEGVELVKDRLDTVLKNPTGYYKSNITKSRHGESVRVHDSNVVYGPWLEGVSSRNAGSSFKGYRTFRTVRQALDKKVQPIANKLASKYLE